jgi:hypothetical protein
MALGNFLTGATLRGILIGVAAVKLAPYVMPALTGASRPLARAAVKSGLVAYEKGREAIAEMGEIMDDLVAEVQAELAEAEAAQAEQPPEDAETAAAPAPEERGPDAG